MNGSFVTFAVQFYIVSCSSIVSQV